MPKSEIILIFMFRNFSLLSNLSAGMARMRKWKGLSISSLIYSKSIMPSFIIGVSRKDLLMPLNIAFRNSLTTHQTRQVYIYKWPNSSLKNKITLAFQFQEHYSNPNKRRRSM